MSTAIRFTNKDKNRNLFFSTLRERVDGYFKENNLSKHNNSTMIVKTVILLSCYILPFLTLLFLHPGPWLSVLCWSVMGFALAGIGMSVMHDANHNAYSASNRVNFWMGHTLNLLGGSVFNWKLQHNVLHHTYTNVVHMDDDIDDKLIMRFSPHTRVKWYHRLQFVYAFLFYGILTLYWALFKDFVQFFRFTNEGVSKITGKEKAIVFLKIILSKVFFWGVFFAVPIGLLGLDPVHFILGFILMEFIAGFVLTTIFQLAHTVEGTTHPLPDKDSNIDNTWAIHQMQTTVNFARGNRMISWYVGGLNFQVEHHLFPTICHVHYPEIAEIVKATAEEFGVPYLENDTFGTALKSHIRTLQRFGKLPPINDAI